MIAVVRIIVRGTHLISKLRIMLPFTTFMCRSYWCLPPFKLIMFVSCGGSPYENLTDITVNEYSETSDFLVISEFHVIYVRDLKLES